MSRPIFISPQMKEWSLMVSSVLGLILLNPQTHPLPLTLKLATTSTSRSVRFNHARGKLIKWPPSDWLVRRARRASEFGFILRCWHLRRPSSSRCMFRRTSFGLFPFQVFCVGSPEPQSDTQVVPLSFASCRVQAVFCLDLEHGQQTIELQSTSLSYPAICSSYLQHYLETVAVQYFKL